MVTRWPVGRLPSMNTASSRISFDWLSSSATAGTLPSGSVRLAQSAKVSAPVERVAIYVLPLRFLRRIQARCKIAARLRIGRCPCGHKPVFTDCFTCPDKCPDQFGMVSQPCFVEKGLEFRRAKSRQGLLRDSEVFRQLLAAELLVRLRRLLPFAMHFRNCLLLHFGELGRNRVQDLLRTFLRQIQFARHAFISSDDFRREGLSFRCLELILLRRGGRLDCFGGAICRFGGFRCPCLGGGCRSAFNICRIDSGIGCCRFA